MILEHISPYWMVFPSIPDPWPGCILEVDVMIVSGLSIPVSLDQPGLCGLLVSYGRTCGPVELGLRYFGILLFVMHQMNGWASILQWVDCSLCTYIISFALVSHQQMCQMTFLTWQAFPGLLSTTSMQSATSTKSNRLMLFCLFSHSPKSQKSQPSTKSRKSGLTIQFWL